NNIAWFLRHFPLFALPGSGTYRLQPVLLEDVGEIIAQAALAEANLTVDAAGPEVMTFRELVEAVARAIGRMPPIISLPPAIALGLIRAAGYLVHEVILSREELAGLMTARLLSHEPAQGTQRVSDWLQSHGRNLGRSYTSELRRHPKQER